MVAVHSLTNRVYTRWGQNYGTFKWDNIWIALLGIARKERQQIHPYENTRAPFHNPKLCFMNHAIYWFDTFVLQQIDPENLSNEQTLRVRLRIAQGLIDRNPHLGDEFKARAKDAFVNIFHQMWTASWNYRFKYIDPLPF